MFYVFSKMFSSPYGEKVLELFKKHSVRAEVTVFVPLRGKGFRTAPFKVLDT